MKKRIVSLLLALVLAASLLPVQVWAEEIDTTGNDTAQGDTLPESSLQEGQNDNTELLPIPEEQSAPLALAAAQENETTPMQSSNGIVASGICGKDGDNLTWTLDEQGMLTISGEGEMEDYWQAGTAPWYEHAESIKEVAIGEGVTHVGDRAFRRLGITSVSSPDSVVSIGDSAFYGLE